MGRDIFFFSFKETFLHPSTLVDRCKGGVMNWRWSWKYGEEGGRLGMLGGGGAVKEISDVGRI